jgi:hypothetical protein
MPIMATASPSKNFKLPSEGTVQAVINSVEDMGIVDKVWQGQARKVAEVRLWWQLNEMDEDGKTPLYMPETFTKSLDEKANLYKRIKGILSKNPPQTMDLEKLTGTNVNAVIVHYEGKDRSGQPKTKAKIAATLKLNPGQAKLEIVPRKKRDEVKAAVAQALKSNAITEEHPITDDDIPF